MTWNEIIEGIKADKLCDEFDSFRKEDGSFDWEGSAVII